MSMEVVHASRKLLEMKGINQACKQILKFNFLERACSLI
jgi:hypothetical protein